jgi:hypothetical protein
MEAGNIVRIQFDDTQRIWWQVGSTGDDVSMEAVANLQLANVSDADVPVPRTFLVFWDWRAWVIPWRRWIEARPVLTDERGEGPDRSQIPANQEVTAHVKWVVNPPASSPPRKFGVRICFLDEAGKKHWIKRVRWDFLIRI